jgi:predicted DNA-binding antitoxin AbrB/MazE fold protein
MQEILLAVYRNGTFVPVVPCSLPEETEVEVRVRDGANIIPPLEPDPIKRAKIKKQLLERMSNAPLPSGAPKLSREQLHERR